MLTALTWRPRVSRAKKAAALAMVQRIYPDSTDDGTAVQVVHPDGDSGVCLLFLLGGKLFRDIGAKGAE